VNVDIVAAGLLQPVDENCPVTATASV